MIQDDFEKWFCEYMDFDAEILAQYRWTDEDGDLGYYGLTNEGLTEEADSLASVALQAWLARDVALTNKIPIDSKVEVIKDFANWLERQSISVSSHKVKEAMWKYINLYIKRE